MRSFWITSRHVALHLAAREVPGAPAVVFVHGLGMWSEVYASLGADFLGALADEGLTVLALDLQGHGRSDGRRGHVPFRDAVANLRESVGFAAERYGEPVGLAGSGLGAYLALYAALEDDRVGAVACHTIADLRSIGRFEPPARRRALAWAAGRARRLGAALPLARLPLRAAVTPDDVFEDPRVVQRWRAFPRCVWWYTLDTLTSNFLAPDDKADLGALEKPVFAITGECDRVVPLDGQEELAARLPDCEMFVLPGAGHGLPIEHSTQTAPRMGEWLRKRL